MRAAADYLVDSDELTTAQTAAVERWLTVRDFTGVRDESRLAILSNEEREPWQQIWKDARDLLERRHNELKNR